MFALRILLVLAALAGAVLAAAFLLQRRLLYFPARATQGAELARAQRLGLVAWRGEGGELRGWRRAKASQPRARALVLHGNAGSALDRSYYVAALEPHGVDVVLLEYPGYGARSGAPTLDTLSAAAVDALDALAKEGAPVWLVGESLGSGVASRAVALRPGAVGGLLLVTPFAELAAVAQKHYPFIPSSFLRDRFAPARDLASFDGPTVVIIAGLDEVVGADQGRLLHDSLRGPKLLIEQPRATHNELDLSADAPLWRDAVAFLTRR